MVWSFQYEPEASSFPRAEIAEGNRGHLELIDTTRDGGTGLVGGAEAFSGRRVKPESVPKKIRWLSKRPFLDFEDAYIHTVSDRMRAAVEELEPQVHQFEPVEFIDGAGTPLGNRWFWQICNRLDSVHREKTNWVLEGTLWRPPPKGLEQPRLVFDLSKIGRAKFWHDKHDSVSSYCVDEVQKYLDANGITGIRYVYREQA